MIVTGDSLVGVLPAFAPSHASYRASVYNEWEYVAVVPVLSDPDGRLVVRLRCRLFGKSKHCVGSKVQCASTAIAVTPYSDTYIEQLRAPSEDETYERNRRIKEGLAVAPLAYRVGPLAVGMNTLRVVIKAADPTVTVIYSLILERKGAPLRATNTERSARSHTRSLGPKRVEAPRRSAHRTREDQVVSRGRCEGLRGSTVGPRTNVRRYVCLFVCWLVAGCSEAW